MRKRDMPNATVAQHLWKVRKNESRLGEIVKSFKSENKDLIFEAGKENLFRHYPLQP